MARGVTLTLYDDAGDPYASGTDIAVMWFDSDVPPDIGQIKGQSAVATTTSGGALTLNIEAVSGLSIGDWGFLVLYKADGGDYKDSLVFASRVQVEDVSGGTVLGPLTDWVRPSNWLPLDVQEGQQKFQGLLAVYPESNFVALRAQGDYTVDWGDGSSPANFASDAQAQKNIAYGDIDPLTDVGLADEQECTLAGATDTITATAHGYRNDQVVALYDLTNTTDLTAHAHYYVRDRTADTFKLSATIGGAAVDFSTTGTGTGKVYAPVHRQCVVTLTMQSGQTLTLFSMNQKHTQAGLQAYSNHWLDAAVAGASLATLIVGGTTPTRNEVLRAFSLIGGNAVTNFSSMFNRCTALQAVPLLDTSAGTSFISMFNGCTALQAVPLLNTSAGTNFSNMFASCATLQAVPLLDTSAGTDFSGMFFGCTALQAVPLLNTSAGTSFISMFNGCTALQAVPLLDTSAGMNFSNMFNICTALQAVPLLDTSAGTNFSNMFANCAALQAVPLLDTSAGTSFFSMFSGCRNLREGALKGTRYAISYSGCKLSAAALNRIYQNLGAPDGGAQTVTVSNNWGTASDNPALVPSGWTVSGS